MPPIHVVSYALVAGFVALNLGVPYLWLIALGGMLNLELIAANDGVMPADPGALAAAGIATDPGSFPNSAAVAEPALLLLGDVRGCRSRGPSATFSASATS